MKAKKMEDGNIFQTLLEVDKQVSLSLSLAATPRSRLGYLRPHMKWLEYSCHGAFWLPGCIICLWLSMDPVKVAFFFNLLIALLLDIILIGVLKASLRRSRPDINKSDMFLTFSIDKMSCPSGHTSRAVMVSFLFIASTPHLYLLHPFLVTWCLCTCASRVLLGRHFVGDVLVGILLGYSEYLIINYILWASPDTAKWFMDFFGDGLVEDF